MATAVAAPSVAGAIHELENDRLLIIVPLSEGYVDELCLANRMQCNLY